MQAHLEFNQKDLGHGAAGSVLHPLVAVALLVTIILILWRPRKSIIFPLLLCTFLVPRGQQLMLAGAHFYVRLILILVAFIRLSKDKFRIAGGLNSIDKVFIAWACYRVFAAIVTNWPGGTNEQLAFLLQALCGYFVLRYLIQNEDDIASAAKALGLSALVLGASMILERHVMVNPWGYYLGGTDIVPLIRNGSVRAQATFGHSILAGCFGATIVPLFIWLWKRKERTWAIIGLTGSTLMVLTANSSTPLLAYIAGVLGVLLWPVRKKMKWIRWSIVATLAILAVVMNAPVWFVIAHVDVVGGSGGYDRAFLIDMCIRHMRDWWLFGTNQNGSWGFDMWDMSDQFVAEAETGGLITIICFIAIISKCFGRLGTMRKRVRPKEQWLLWCLGATMLAHIFAYFGVAYWDQSQIWWFTFLAMVSAATVPAATSAVAKSRPPSRKEVLLPEVKEPAPAAPAGVLFRQQLRPWGGPEL